MVDLRPGLAAVVALLALLAGAGCPQGAPGLAGASGAVTSTAAALSPGAAGASAGAPTDPSGATATAAITGAALLAATSALGDISVGSAGALAAASTASADPASLPTGAASSAAAPAAPLAAATRTASARPWTTIDIEVLTEGGLPVANGTVAIVVERPVDGATITATVRLDGSGEGSLPLPRLSDPRVTARVIGVDVGVARKLGVAQRSHASTTDVHGAQGMPRMRFRLPRDLEHPIEALDGPGRPLARARLVLEHTPQVAGAETWRWNVDLDDQGRAARRGLPSGPMRWSIVDAGGRRHEGVLTVRTAKPGVQVRLTPQGAVVVSALDPEGRPFATPPAGTITLLDPRAADPAPVFKGPLGPDGTVRCEAPAGEYEVAFTTERASGGAATTLRDVRAEAALVIGGEGGPALLRVPGNATGAAELRLEVPGVVAARVRRGGAPAAGVRVEAASHTLLGVAWSDSAVTGEDGVARLLTRGPTVLSAQDLPAGRRAAPVRLDFEPGATASRDLDVVDAGTLRLELAAPGSVTEAASPVQGYVLASGRSLDAARWVAEPAEGRLVSSLSLAPGAYEVAWEERVFPAEVRAGETTTVALSLEAPTVTASVSDPIASTTTASTTAASTPTASTTAAATTDGAASAPATRGTRVITAPAPAVEAPASVTRGALVIEGGSIRDAYVTGRAGVPLDALIERHDRDRLFAVRRIEVPAGRARVALSVFGDPEGQAEARYVLFVVMPRGGEVRITLPRPGRGAVAVLGACRADAAPDTTLELVGLCGPVRTRPVNEPAVWDRLPAGRYRLFAADRFIEEIDLAEGESRDLGRRDVSP